MDINLNNFCVIYFKDYIYFMSSNLYIYIYIYHGNPETVHRHTAIQKYFIPMTKPKWSPVLSRFLFLFFFHFYFVGFVTSNMETHNINPCHRGGNLETNIKCFFISCDVDVINLATKNKIK